MHHLKKNVADFTVVDGPFAGRTFRAGKPYAEIPPREKHKFEEAKSRKPAPIAKAGRVEFIEPNDPRREPFRKTKKQADGNDSAPAGENEKGGKSS